MSGTKQVDDTDPIDAIHRRANAAVLRHRIYLVILLIALITLLLFAPKVSHAPANSSMGATRPSITAPTAIPHPPKPNRAP